MVLANQFNPTQPTQSTQDSIDGLTPFQFKEWEHMRDAGGVERSLDIVTDVRNPMILKVQSPKWMNALTHLSGAIVLFGHDTHPNSQRLIAGLKERFPPAIAAFEHPLACVSKNPQTGVQLLQILGYLATVAATDGPLLSSLKEYDTPTTAFITWLVLADSTLHTEDLSISFGGCVSNVNIVDIFERGTMMPVVERLGPRTVGKLLDAYFRKPDVIDKQFVNTCLITVAAVDSNPFVEQLLDQKTLTRVAHTLWKELAMNSMQVEEGLVTLWVAMNVVIQACLQLDRLHDYKSIMVVVDMLKTCDLFGLCYIGLYSSAMVYSTTKEDGSFDLLEFQEFIQGVIRACQFQPNLIKTHIQPFLLPFLDHIRDLDGPPLSAHGERIVSIWMEVVHATCGMSESALRIEARKAEINERKINTGSIGCSWYQCIFHSGEADGAMTVAMFLDENCQCVQYCSRYCQKRDWYDGKHRNVCRVSL